MSGTVIAASTASVMANHSGYQASLDGSSLGLRAWIRNQQNAAGSSTRYDTGAAADKNSSTPPSAMALAGRNAMSQPITKAWVSLPSACHSALMLWASRVLNGSRGSALGCADLRRRAEEG